MVSVWNLGSRSPSPSATWPSAFFLVRSSGEQCASPGVYEPGMDVARREHLVLHAGDQEIAIGADALDPQRSQCRCGTAPCSIPIFAPGDQIRDHRILEIGSAPCRESVCQYVSISVVAVSLK